MKKIIYSGILSILTFVSAQAQMKCTPLPAGCANADLNNAYLNSYQPATIEYDHVVSSRSGTLIRQNSGVFVWGQNMKPNGTTAQYSAWALNNTNYPMLNGMVFKFAAASGNADNTNQYVALTSTGLYVWGAPGNMISTALKNTSAMSKLSLTATHNGNSEGLPISVKPTDVKMLFATYKTLVLVTCDGNVWVLSDTGGKNGTGSTSVNDIGWTRVKTGAGIDDYLTNIVAVRGTSSALFALGNDNTLWTWGKGALPAEQAYATPMTTSGIPNGTTFKMIGMSGSLATSSTSYYLLATNGNLYTLGYNNYGQLGNYSTAPSTSAWVQTKTNNSEWMSDISWISPREHSDGPAAINALSKNGTLYAWGSNQSGMLGLPAQGTDTIYHPTIPESAKGQFTMMVETGGAFSIALKSCYLNYGFTGRLAGGSMGNGSTDTRIIADYSFENTSNLNLCGVINVIPKVNYSFLDQLLCEDVPYPLSGNGGAAGKFTVLSGNAIFDSTTSTLHPTGAGPVTVAYTFTHLNCETKTDIIEIPQYDYGNLDARYPEAVASTAEADYSWLGVNVPESDCGIKEDDDADGLTILMGNTPVSGNGTRHTPFMLVPGNTYDFKVMVNNSTEQDPVYLFLWCDVNGDGDFKDTDDIYKVEVVQTTGTSIVSFPIQLPETNASGGAIRLVVTTLDPRGVAIGRVQSTVGTWHLNDYITVINGEVEDYFFSYMKILPADIVNFTIVSHNNDLVLNWTTQTEQNNKGFFIEKSDDNQQWTTIGFVPSAAIAGNSQERLAYTFSDKNIKIGTYYYRLRQVGMNGHTQYSPAKAFRMGAQSSSVSTAFPNPVVNLLTITGISPGATISLYNSMGQLLQRIPSPTSTYTLNCATLQPAVYNIIIRDNKANTIATHRILKVQP